MVSIDDDVIARAKSKGINVSNSAQIGIMKTINMNEIDEKIEYDVELARLDPDNYWINPQTGKCQKRREAQFFQVEEHGVVPISQEEWLNKHRLKGWGEDKANNNDIIKSRINRSRNA